MIVNCLDGGADLIGEEDVAFTVANEILQAFVSR